MSREYPARVDSTLRELGISRELIEQRGLRLFCEPEDLVPCGKSADGREHLPVPEASSAWLGLSGAAAVDGMVYTIEYGLSCEWRTAQ